MSNEEISAWVRRYLPYDTDEECLAAYEIFRNYRDEGQSMEVSLQYAGLI